MALGRPFVICVTINPASLNNVNAQSGNGSEALMFLLSQIPVHLNEVFAGVNYGAVAGAIPSGYQAELGKRIQDHSGPPRWPANQEFLLRRVSSKHPDRIDQLRNRSGVEERRIEQDDTELLSKPVGSPHVVSNEAPQPIEAMV